MRSGGVCVFLITTFVAVSACGLPRDVDNTTEQARERGFVRAGAIAGANTISLDSTGRPVGNETTVVMGFAQSLGLEVRWTVASESHLMELLERGALDVVVGGIESSSPWSEHVAFSAPISGDDEEPLVAAVRSGSNQWLLAFERFLGTSS